jgi:pantoate--beta-alanine ligase
MRQIAGRVKKSGKTIGLVPTMGALHEGHLSLVKKALSQNNVTIVSIFVNPAQFGPKEDYLRYPRPLAKDSALCRRAGVDYIFAPKVKQMYPEGYSTYVKAEGISDILCGNFRPGHFRGVATVVAKLFNITAPDRAYFGQKDYQQLKVIERMANDLNFPVAIVPCHIFREPDGLAMSSRNSYLSRKERLASSEINKALQHAAYLVKYNKLKNREK